MQIKKTLSRVLFPPREVRTVALTFVPFLIAVAAIAQEPAPAANPPAATNATANPAGRGGSGGFGSGRGAASLPPGVKAERNIPYVENGHRNQGLAA